jgi:hypothetical protein
MVYIFKGVKGKEQFCLGETPGDSREKFGYVPKGKNSRKAPEAVRIEWACTG